MYTPELLTRKSSKTIKMDKSLILRQVRAKLDSLSPTVESQTAHILALKKHVERLTTQAKRNVQADKASQTATKKIQNYGR